MSEASVTAAARVTVERVADDAPLGMVVELLHQAIAAQTPFVALHGLFEKGILAAK